ncbi:MAG: class I SAM-dependent methyltransferase [Rubrobacteraceae bacterium]
MSEPPDAGLVERQISYYRARALEYDEWFFRHGRHDRGIEWNRAWFSEVEEVREELSRFRPAGEVLELACGTGLWTEQLDRYADHITAVDASPEVLKLNHGRLRDERVHYVRADLFDWRPGTAYDVVFFGFWLSHVPPERFGAFWELVRSTLKPGGRVFFVDSLRSETPAEKERTRGASGDHVTIRKLNDGREFRIVKVFHDPEDLSSRLCGLGWNVRVRTTENHLLYGMGEPSP